MTSSTALSLIRGDDEVLSVVVLQPNSTTPQDISGYSTIRFTIKRKITETDLEALVALDLTDGITVDDAVNGEVTIEIDSALTDSLTTNFTGVWDLQIVDAVGRIQTIKSGTVSIVRDVTRTAP